MSDLVAGLLLGLAGSVHCLAMCGPLVAAVRSGVSQRAGRFGVLYQSGRVLTYAALGAVAGLIGHAMTTGGAGRVLTIAAGVGVLVAAIGPRQPWSLVRAIGGLTSGMLHRVSRQREARPDRTAFAMGIVNALLPCGLVYVALAAAVTLGSVVRSAEFMLMFGLGTAPALGAVWAALPTLSAVWRGRLRYAAPIAMVLVGVLLIVRGASTPAAATHGQHMHVR